MRSATQALRVSIEHERAELAAARADVLAERNRLAREVHDVLAHTLGALSVQLEALSARAQTEASAATPDLRRGLAHAKALASDGLGEARRAVAALRDDAVALDVQVQTLCAATGSALEVLGSPVPLAPETTLALYRVAQESLTNAAKHAPEAPTGVRLEFGADAVTLTVDNGPAPLGPGPLSDSGGGFGLDGIRERVRLLGGEVSAGPDGGGWRVAARVPR